MGLTNDAVGKLKTAITGWKSGHVSLFACRPHAVVQGADSATQAYGEDDEERGKATQDQEAGGGLISQGERPTQV